jgi:hypothetical protein
MRRIEHMQRISLFLMALAALVLAASATALAWHMPDMDIVTPVDGDTVSGNVPVSVT